MTRAPPEQARLDAERAASARGRKPAQAPPGAKRLACNFWLATLVRNFDVKIPL
jgi:hypothetical protein